MAGENAWIWEVQSGAGSGQRATAGDTHTQAFNNTGKVPSGGAYIDSINVNFRRAVPENEAVDEDNNEIQDMGIGGLDITIHGFSGDADNDVAANCVNKYIKWLKDGNTTTGYTKGRFGLELDNAPQWDVVPTSTYGYHIRDIDWNYIGDKVDTVEFTIRLALGGDLQNAI